jgi:lactoylglutathione lyase
MQGITGIGHVALNVRDLNKSLEFYTQTLGFPEMMRLPKENGETWLVYLRITDQQYLELFPGAETEKAPESWHANGMTHLCLMVDNLDAVVAQIKAKGVTLLIEPKSAADGNRQAWLSDPDGNRIELMEMGADSQQLQAIKRLHAAGV